MNEHLPSTHSDDTSLLAENQVLREERDEYRNALYAVLWQSISPPTEEEIASSEPVDPWLEELVQDLRQSSPVR